MIEFLYEIDKTLFYFFNHTISNSVFDKFFPYVTEVRHWYIAYFILLLILFFKGGKIGKIAALMTIVLITVSDQLSSSLLKNLIARPRPCNILPDVNILVFCSGSYSMPSSHAVNNFTVAAFFSSLYPKFKWILYSVAALMAISRPYVGVHYPSDIIVGGVIGILIGLLFAFITKYIDSLISNKYNTAKTTE